MTKDRGSDVGFCVTDQDADLVADLLVSRLRQVSSEMESEANRLYRGRNSFELRAGARRDLSKTIRRLQDVAQTLRDVQKAQERTPYLQAAE
jgi:hypothetical protein